MSPAFKPYIPADRIVPECTLVSVCTGIALAVVFGAANAYLGLRVGMTVSASIPAAVISMGVIRILMKRDSILENNLVQTIGSAGESLAAGAVFTLPALFLWAGEGVIAAPSLLAITLIALCGGLLGVFFMVPLRNALIVREHEVLPYPEGTACAEVLLVGEQSGADGGSSARFVFIGMGFAAAFKFLVDGLKIVPGVVGARIDMLKTELSAEVYPALVGVGYICGLRICALMLSGGAIGWLVLIPMIAIFGGDTVLHPGTEPIAALYTSGGAEAIWANYIRYIGAGAVVAAGAVSLCRSLPLIAGTFADMARNMRGGGKIAAERTALDMNLWVIVLGVAGVGAAVWLLPQVPVLRPVGALFVVVFGFLFSAVSSRMVGLVGSSNNPVSGMTIATLLVAALFLKLAGITGAQGMLSALTIGALICIAANMAGDTSQDLKTGYLLGATPRTQQIGELVGAIAAALTIGGVMVLLDRAWSFGSPALSAPQATLMKMIVEGVLDGNLPWSLILIGCAVSLSFELAGVSSLAMAIGLYLPLELSTTIMIGGLISWLADRRNRTGGETGRGILFCSGLIAGEGLVGILLALLAVTGIDRFFDLSAHVDFGATGGVLLLVAMTVAVFAYAMQKTAPAGEAAQ